MFTDWKAGWYDIQNKTKLTHDELGDAIFSSRSSYYRIKRALTNGETNAITGLPYTPPIKRQQQILEYANNPDS